MATGFALDHLPVRNRALADAGVKVVSLYYDDQKRTVTTEAATVGELLKRANITLDKGDAVEPAADTAIPQGLFNINVYRGQLYRIIDGAQVTMVKSAQKSPRLVAADGGITVYPEDLISTQPVNDFLGDKVVAQNVVINRALPVTVRVDGTSRLVRTHATTVGVLLAERGISLGEKDSVTPGLDVNVTDGATIEIMRVNVVVTTKEEVVAKQVIKRNDVNMLRGDTRVETAGKDGKRRVTYQLTYHNGEVVQSKQLAVERVEEAVARVEVIGTRVLYTNDIITMAEQMAANRGWVNDQWDALFNVWTRESNFNPNAVNSSSGACGIPQAMPCSKIVDKSVEGQITWGLSYIADRYGDPVNAWSYWQRHRSY